MIGAPQMNWRQIMQMPQQAPPQGGMPTQNASGGWMMPRMAPPQMPQPMQQMAPQQAPAPMMGQQKPFIDWNSFFSGY